MRAALAVTAFLLATLLAGCSNPIQRVQPDAGSADVPLELPSVGLERGADVGLIGVPAWKPGYHYRFEQDGARQSRSTASGPDGLTSDAEDEQSAATEAYNYTVARIEQQLGETRVLALQSGDAVAANGPLLSFDPAHLKPLPAGLGETCGPGGPGHWHPSYGGGYGSAECTAYAYVTGATDASPPLSFPLRDGKPRQERIDASDSPALPLGPVVVVTSVLGLKEVDTAFGPMQAVHVHQRFAANLTQAAERLREQEPEAELGVLLAGSVNGTRDVFYAPSLLNVVLDLAVTEADYGGSFVRDGEVHAFHEAERSWTRLRLVEATLEPREELSMAEVRAALASGASASGLLWRDSLLLEVDSSGLNLAADEQADIRVTGAADSVRLRIDVLDATGFTVASQDGATMRFQPRAVGPYLAVATATTPEGETLGQDYRVLTAYYLGSVEGRCQPVTADAVNGCDPVPLPAGWRPASLVARLSASAVSPSVVGPQGELVLDFGDGQQMAAPVYGGTATLSVDDPARFGRPMDEWTLAYRPDAAVAPSAWYDIELWPGDLPSFVYERALRGAW